MRMCHLSAMLRRTAAQFKPTASSQAPALVSCTILDNDDNDTQDGEDNMTTMKTVDEGQMTMDDDNNNDVDHA